MLTIASLEQATIIQDVEIRSLVLSRIDEITNGEDFDPEIHGVFIVMEHSDTSMALENVSGCPVMSNPIAGTVYGEADFNPLFEYLGEHPSCFEMVFVSGDGDFGIVIFIPKTEGIDRELLAFCQHYAQPVEEAS